MMANSKMRQHNHIYYNGAQHTDNQFNYIQHNDTKYNYTQNNDIQHDASIMMFDMTIFSTSP